MKRIRPKHVALLVGIMAAVVLAIWVPRYVRQQRLANAAARQHQAQNAAAARVAAQKVAAERAADRSRYLQPGFARKTGFKNVAIAAASADGQADRRVADALAGRLKDENLVLFTSFFKPAFYADGLFNDAFAGSLECVDQLALTNTLDALLLAQEQLRFSTNGTRMDHVITAHLRLDVAFYPLDMMRRELSWTFAADGAGVNPNAARKTAEGRLCQQITDDTNISLVPLSPDNPEFYP